MPLMKRHTLNRYLLRSRVPHEGLGILAGFYLVRTYDLLSPPFFQIIGRFGICTFAIVHNKSNSYNLGQRLVFLWRHDQRNDGLPFKKEKSMPLTSKHDYFRVGNGDGDKNRGHRDSFGAHAFEEGGSFLWVVMTVARYDPSHEVHIHEASCNRLIWCTWDRKRRDVYS